MLLALIVKIEPTVLDLNGNTLDPNSIEVKVDTLNPLVDVSLTGQSVSDGSYDFIEYDTAAASADSDERVHPVLQTNVEDQASYTVQLTHEATQTTITISDDKDGNPLVGDGNPDTIFLSAAQIDAIGQGPISVSVVATDPAGNQSTAATTSGELVLKTGTFLMSNGVVSAQQIDGVSDENDIAVFTANGIKSKSLTNIKSNLSLKAS